MASECYRNKHVPLLSARDDCRIKNKSEAAIEPVQADIKPS